MSHIVPRVFNLILVWSFRLSLTRAGLLVPLVGLDHECNIRMGEWYATIIRNGLHGVRPPTLCQPPIN